jgi:hypothetical protein
LRLSFLWLLLGRPRQVPSKSLFSHDSLSSSCLILNCIITAAKTATLNYLTLWTLEDFVWVIKSGRIRWAGHVARMGARRSVYRVLVGKPLSSPYPQIPLPEDTS